MVEADKICLGPAPRLRRSPESVSQSVDDGASQCMVLTPPGSPREPFSMVFTPWQIFQQAILQPPGTQNTQFTRNRGPIPGNKNHVAHLGETLPPKCKGVTPTGVPTAHTMQEDMQEEAPGMVGTGGTWPTLRIQHFEPTRWWLSLLRSAACPADPPPISFQAREARGNITLPSPQDFSPGTQPTFLK